MTELEKQYADVAIAELTKKELGYTGQFLKIHEIMYENGDPKVVFVRIIENGDVQVYFAVKDEKFYFCVRVELAPSMKVRWAYSEDLVQLSFAANSETLSSDDLLKLTTLKPTKVWNKGDYYRFNKDRSSPNSGISFTPYTEPDNVESTLNHLLDFLEQDIEGVNRLANAATAFIFSTITKHNGNTHIGGIHLDTVTIKRLAALNVSIDIDIYANGNLYKYDDDWMKEDIN